MAIKTRLTLSATPGRPYAAWQPKTEAVEVPKSLWDIRFPGRTRDVRFPGRVRDVRYPGQ